MVELLRVVMVVVVVLGRGFQEQCMSMHISAEVGLRIPCWPPASLSLFVGVHSFFTMVLPSSGYLAATVCVNHGSVLTAESVSS
ncbi:hypothetical protein SDJN03_25878, partial [Cucurbita argyrosperma subsp. sororia]